MANYVLLGEITLGVDTASITFSNIPQTGYTDLVIKSSTRGDGSFVRAEFNGDTGANYNSRFVRGNGSTSASSVQTFIIPDVTNQSTYTANTFSNSEIYIPNYNVSGIPKTTITDLVSENNATENYMACVASRWTGTAAISSIRIFVGSSSLFAGSTYYLYGVAKLGVSPVVYPKATGGDIITNDGTYWYHAFLSSGVFTPTQALSCATLVVAGGGAGGGGGASSGGAGGGAGGVRLVSNLAYTNGTAYAVTIGAGGSPGGTSSFGRGTSGTASSINSYSASGGGGGGSIANNSAIANGGNGGSGGGSTATAGIVFTAGTGNAGGYTPVEGYAGGVGATDGASYDNGGGGGGAGAVGTAANSAGGGAGGVGAGGTGYTNYAILNAMGSATTTGVLSSSNYYYAGGGGGAGYAGVGKTSGAGGTGGGGSGVSTNTTGGNATANTGGGGGGGSTGGTGGSGIVIVRYTMA